MQLTCREGIRPNVLENVHERWCEELQIRPKTASKIPTLRPKSVGGQPLPKPDPNTSEDPVPDHLPHRLGHLPSFLRRRKLHREEEPPGKLPHIREEESWTEELMALPNIEDETPPPLVGTGELDVLVCGNWDRQRTFTL
ncbi:hypothetical protein pipiens_012099 [Culex pipiens pipiens]|uniref:Uncharacterized protein n=1 Tax=Culex pipiens pipiens TaxID=38569 RepID=A0ABD1D3R2_CULPP